jgi:signal transduction histidine kinase
MKPDNDFALLLASSVHDIKNSLGMLLSTLETVIRAAPPGDDEQRRQFATLQGEAARINNDLLYLLGIYRLHNNQLPLQLREVFVADFLDDQLAGNQLLFEIRGLAIELQCDSELRAYFDPQLVGGMLNNVLVNAARYASRRIAVEARSEQGGVLISVRDDGPGFPPAMLAAADNRDRGIDFASGSSNLGLYFAERVAQMHRRGDQRGHIALAKIDGGGGCFSLWLP